MKYSPKEMDKEGNVGHINVLGGDSFSLSVPVLVVIFLTARSGPISPD